MNKPTRPTDRWRKSTRELQRQRTLARLDGDEKTATLYTRIIMRRLRQAVDRGQR